MTSIHDFLSADHDRIDGLLRLAVADPGSYNLTAYAGFRKGLLRHISMEEKVLFPAMQRMHPGERIPVLDRLHGDHGALVALLVPPPSPEIIATIRAILTGHNALEEEGTGVYRVVEQDAGANAEEILRDLQSTPDVPVHPHNLKPEVLEATRRAVERAGYSFPAYDVGGADSTG